jgi:hypothetical protein
MKKFIEIVNNYDFNENVEIEQKELIPVDNIIKVYQHICDEKPNGRVVAVVFMDPALKRERTFYERAGSEYLFQLRWESIWEALCQ